MGMIRIEVAGSFDTKSAKQFGAIKHGHAHAVAQAIQWLSSEILPAAIAQDHALQAAGAKPKVGFSKPDK